MMMGVRRRRRDARRREKVLSDANMGGIMEEEGVGSSEADDLLRWHRVPACAGVARREGPRASAPASASSGPGAQRAELQGPVRGPRGRRGEGRGDVLPKCFAPRL